MVRELTIDFLHKKKGHLDESTEKELESAIAFALANSKGIDDANLASMSKVGIPFWIVQVSNQHSIVLSPYHNGGNEFHLTKIKGLNEVIRKLRSSIDEPEDIPELVPKLINNLRQLEPEPHKIPFIEEPALFSSIGNLVSAMDPNEQPARTKPLVDSRKALEISEIYQELKASASLKVEKLHGVQKLIKENVGSKIKALKNLIDTENRRWAKRIADMENSNKEEKEAIEDKRDKQLYDLKEKHTIGLRAIVSDYSRETDKLKSFYEKQIGRIDQSRVDIQQEPANVKRALRIMKELTSSLSDDESTLENTLETILDQGEEVQSKLSEAESNFQQKSEEIQKNAELRMQELDEKLASLKRERDEKIGNLESLLSEARNHLADLEQEVADLIIRLENDLMEVKAFQLDSNSIEGLAPLSRLDVTCYLAKYSKGGDVLLTPCLLPEERIEKKLDHVPVSEELHDSLLLHLKIWDKENREFEVALNNAAEEGQIFDKPALKELVEDGFGRLQRMKLLQEDVKEHYLNMLSD